MLGTILQAPESVQINEGGEATFTCRAVGNVVWSINGIQIVNQINAQSLALTGVIVPLSTPSQSTVNISAFDYLNGTTLQCLVVDPDNMTAILSSSDTVQLLVLGKSRFCTVSRILSSH